jgi:prevent-host-death family protein
MKPSRVRPIGQLKARASDVIRELAECRQSVVVTVNGEAKAVLQDIAAYEEVEDTLSLLKILALAGRQVEERRVTPVRKTFARLRRRARA